MTEELPAVGPSSNGSDASPTGKRKKRVRAWTASDRAKHRVFEKGRREAFNERLMVSMRLASVTLRPLKCRVGPCKALAFSQQCKGEPTVEACDCRRKREAASNASKSD